MRMNEMVIGTLRDVPAESTKDIESFKLLLRGGILRKQGSGKFNILPLGNKVFKNIDNFCMNLINVNNSNEVILNEFNFEEIISILKLDINTYKQLPKTFYCKNTKEEDNIKPKFGIVKAKKYLTFNAFEMTKGKDEANYRYNLIKDSILENLKNININGEYIEVIGKNEGHCEKLIINSEFGDNSVFSCNKCGYNKHITMATSKVIENKEVKKPLEKVHTPNIKTVDELATFLSIDKANIVKTLIYKADDRVVAVLIRGDRDGNEEKLRKQLNYPSKLEMGDVNTVFNATGANVGFAGPIGIKVDELLVDEEVLGISNFVVGGNETDYHYINVSFSRDFVGVVGDFKNIVDGDVCPVCGELLHEEKVLELGILYNGLVNNELMYIDELGMEEKIAVNTYTLGTSRLLGIIAENNRDENGIIWPENIAPFEVSVIVAVSKNEEQMKKGEEIYNLLLNKNINVVFDDRDERAGAKFKDCDLLGVPYRITVGKKINEGIVEFKKRVSNDFEAITVEECIEKIVNSKKV